MSESLVRKMFWCAKIALYAVTVFALAALFPGHAEAVESSKPNIVFVLFDDMGWGQPQCYDAASKLRTPNLDNLARQGMRFTDAHSASGVCTPTRYGVLTGRYPSRIGQFGVLTTFSKPIIPASRMTVASMLKQQGYATACIGKWHLGMNWVDGKPGSQDQVPIGAKMTEGPNALGFDYFYGFTHARNIGTIIEQDAVVEHVEEDENQPRMIAKAVKWLDERKQDEPFFLYFPMCPPHTPIAPSSEFLGKSGAVDVIKKDPKYGDWVYQGDAMLGRILDALDRNGLAENTLVIATSDNGAEGRQYDPLRESKRSIYEGGHRIPFVARWPGKVQAGSVNERTICLNDLMATAAELVGVELPDNAAEDSHSRVAELLERNQSTDGNGTELVIVHQSSKGDLAIRRGKWKLVFLKQGKRELYDIHADLSETKDVAGEHLEVVESMTAAMQGLIDEGRSTPGTGQAKEFPLTLPKLR